MTKDNLAPWRRNLSYRTHGVNLCGCSGWDIEPGTHGDLLPMLWTITIVLVVLWLVGFIGFHLVGWWIHLLLVLAVIVLIFSLLSGRRGI